ncbi:hypothetical protein HYX18_03945 [Candidatus Woesearchaeota archaeon]|nr:hypothetical protein [Candidatus Woesearchaeota archaeon]
MDLEQTVKVEKPQEKVISDDVKLGDLVRIDYNEHHSWKREIMPRSRVGYASLFMDGKIFLMKDDPAKLGYYTFESFIYLNQITGYENFSRQNIQS